MTDKLLVFAQSVAEILAGTLAAPGESIRWTIIANPCAGGFTISRRWEKHRKALAAAAEKARMNPQRSDVTPYRPRNSAGEAPVRSEIPGGAESGLIATTGPGHAMEITNDLIEEIMKERIFHLIITAGGDGTSLEVLHALYHAPASVRSRCAILRLPMGTGNDGADSWELSGALELLTAPVRIDFARGLRLSTASGKTWPSGEPLLAFNILSVGLDAFVTHMTNKMKGSMPGDSYKFWVDMAALFYDRIYKTGPMELAAYDEAGREVRNFREKLVLCAMGAGGHRSYGSHKMILPDDRNVCAVKQMSVWRKVAVKGKFTDGTHVAIKESILFSASRVSLSGLYPILAQMDGETILLEKDDFPAVIELTEAVIPVLKKR